MELSSKDLFAVQSEIAEAIARALQAQLSPADRRELGGIPTTDDRAYDAYLTGRSLIDPESQADLQRAVASLESAVALDPRFALAWASLSEARVMLYWHYDPSIAGLLASAFDAARRALELDADLPEGHLSLGRCHYVSRDYASAMQEYEIAERRLPSSAELLLVKGTLHRRTGQWETSADELARAIELSPREGSLQAEQAFTLQCLGRYDAALRLYDRSRDLQASQRFDVFQLICELSRDGELGPEAAARLPELAAGIEVEEIVGAWRLWLMARDASSARALLASAPELLSSQWSDYPRSLLEAITDEVAGDAASAQPKYEAARNVLLAEIEARPSDARAHAALGLALVGLGRREEALREADLATGLLPIERDSIVGGSIQLDRFFTELRAGALDDAMRTLEVYLSRPALFSLRALVLDPRLDALKEHAGFEELRRRHESR